LKFFSFSGVDDLPISDEDKGILKQSITPLTFKKNHVVIHQGEICSQIYFIHTGLVKLSYLTLDGKEFIKSFIHEDGMFGSLHSQLTGGDSTFSVIALEDLEVEALPFSKLQVLLQNYPALQYSAMVFFQQLALKKEVREYEFLCLSARQRYEKFCQQRPELLERIKQADLALYLGITPIALSRMKHRHGV